VTRNTKRSVDRGDTILGIETFGSTVCCEDDEVEFSSALGAKWPLDRKKEGSFVEQLG
jgi:hypothetical protein